MKKILTLNKISPAGLDMFDKTKYQCLDDCADADAVLVRSAKMHDMELPASLKAIARAGAGVNNIPVDKCSELGIAVFNTPGANANAVKELVIAALLLSSRKIVPAVRWLDSMADSDQDIPALVEKEKSKFAGPEILGKKLGVIGLGAIGVLVANAAHALGMEVYGYDPYISVDAAWGLSRSVIHAKSLKEIFSTCDYISLHVPLNAETKGMINTSSLNSMKNGVRILNFSRGELVVNEDMLAALEDSKVKVYLTDFPEKELLNNKGVITLPHLGASTPESEDNCAYMAALELIEFLECGNIKNSVNLPNVELPRSNLVRIGIIHKNIPNMLSQISAVMASVGINIENMINKSKKDYAYTLFDILGTVSDDDIKKLSAIESVIKVTVYNK